MLSKNETFSRGQLWYELYCNTSFEIFSNRNIFLMYYWTHCPHLRLKKSFLTFLHTPKSNYDTLTSLMIHYSSQIYVMRHLNKMKGKNKVMWLKVHMDSHFNCTIVDWKNFPLNWLRGKLCPCLNRWFKSKIKTSP